MKMNFFLTYLNSYRFYISKILREITNNCHINRPELCYAVNANNWENGGKQQHRDPLSDLNDIINNGFLWAVPKARRSLERRMTRRMGFGKMLIPKKNLIVCDACGHFHPVHTVCGNCYEKVKQETEIMKEVIEKELKLDPIDREVVVLYENDPKEGRMFQGKRIVELPKERPSWFSRNLLAKDSEIPRPKPNSIGTAFTPPTVKNSDK